MKSNIKLTRMDTCAECGGNNIYVRNTQTLKNGCIKRCRHCIDCGARFSTIEVDIDQFKAMRRIFDMFAEQLGGGKDD